METMVMTMPSPANIHSHSMSELDIELAALLDSLSLQQHKFRAGKRAGTRAAHRIRHPNERRRELPLRRYGPLCFLRRALLAGSLRVPAGPHALVRPGRGAGADHLRRVPRAHLHTSRGVRRPPGVAHGLLGGVQRARTLPGAPRVAR